MSPNPISQNTNPFLKPPNMNANKRTRSQLQIAEFDVSYGRSPLKDAKRAMRKVNLNSKSPLSNVNGVEEQEAGPSENLNASICVDTQPDIEDDILLSPRKSEEAGQAKRSSSPSFDNSMDNDDTNPLKRPKLKITSVESGVKGPLDMFFTRQVSNHSTPKPNTAIRRIFSETRPLSSSKSKLGIPETPTLKKLRELPEIDMRTMTPSPRKVVHGLGFGLKSSSPSKGILRAVSDGSVMQTNRMDMNAISEASGASGKSSDIFGLRHTHIVPTLEVQTASERSLTASVVKENDQVLFEDDTHPSEKQDFRLPFLEENISKQHAVLDVPVISKETLANDKPNESSLPGLAAVSSLPPSPKPMDDVPDKREEAGLSNVPHQHEEKATSPLPRSPHVSLPVEKRSSSTPAKDLPQTISTAALIASSSTSSSSTTSNSTTSLSKPIQRKKRHPKPITTSTPRIRLTRAAALRQQKLVKQRTSSIQPVSPSKPTANTSAHIGRLSLARATTCPPEDSPTRPTTLSFKTQLKQDTTAKGKGAEEDSQRSHRPFVITKPSSLSPEKRSSMSGFGLFSTSSFFPPSVKDPASRARTATTLSNLNSALEKLALPPPSKPCSSSDEGERPRPSTSMGFTRDFDEQLTLGTRPGTVSRPSSRAGSVVPGKKSMFPPPPPLFSDTASNDKGKGKVSLPLKHFSFGKHATTEQAGRTSIFGSGSSRGTFTRPLARMKASQKTTLETVQGSPVKPSSSNVGDEDVLMPSSSLFGTEKSSTTKDDEGGDNSLPSDNNHAATNGNSSDSGNVSADGKELKKITKLNASRRASMAFSALTQSLTTPQARDQSMGSEQSPASESSSSNKKRTVNAVFTAPSSRPVRAAASRSFTANTTPLGLVKTQSEPIILGSSTAPAAYGESDGEEGTRTGKKASNRSKMPGSLDVLNNCTIFVDVKTEDGEDAGALFVDMLRGLGAKILARVGQTCTHVVYKNGLPSTLTRYRLLDEPRPLVVNISWVVECVEKRERIDESRFSVDLEAINVAGANKRRKSILPKQLPAMGPMDMFMDNKASGSRKEKPPVRPSFSHTSYVTNDNDASENSLSRLPMSNSKLTPLDMARRRNVTNPR